MATFTVTTLTDSVNATDGKLSLREALAQANATTAADTITFASSLEGKTIALTRGQLEITSDVTITGDPDHDGSGVTIDQRTDDAQQDYSGEYGARVLAIDGDHVTLSGLTITGGSVYGDGGGIWAGGGTLRLERCAVVGNGTWGYDNTTYGGAIRVYRGALDVVSSTIAGNGASGGHMSGYGGAIAAGAFLYGQSASVRIVDSTITGNTADIGGGVLLGGGSTVRLANSIVLGNLETYRGEDYRPSDVDGEIAASNGHNVLGAAYDSFADLTSVDPAIVFASTDDWGGGELVLMNGTWVVPLRDVVGNPALAAADPAGSSHLDQRGAERPSPDGTLPDIGAFELAQTVTISHRPTPGPDLIKGTAGADTIDALAGNDTVYGLGGADRLKGGAGDDTLMGGDGNDRLEGGADADTLQGGTGDDRLDGGAGMDLASYADALTGVTLSLAVSGPQEAGDRGRDTLVGIEGLVGSAYADKLQGDAGANWLQGGAGDDLVQGGLGNDRLDGGTEDWWGGGDTVSYEEASGSVQVSLTSGRAYGALGKDILTDFENIRGGRGWDSLGGDSGYNHLDGNAGNDKLYGLGGEDWLDGGGGEDMLLGGVGSDRLTGGAGRDRFDYDRATDSRPDAPDYILDFQGVGAAVGDRIDLADIYAGTLTFRGTGAFTGIGQVRIQTDDAGNTAVLVNLGGDKAPEMAIWVDGDATPGQWVAGDFIL
ncbi:MAG: choice-of-anchor Q domain-containing protein [Geminicoccaceae bacterium]